MTRTEDLVASVLARLGDRRDQVTGGSVASAPAARKAQKRIPGQSKDKASRRRSKKQNHEFPVKPRVIQIVHKPKTFMNHSYRDFSSVPAELDWTEPKTIEDMSFAQKVHHMLSQKEYEKWIAWRPHGRAFAVLVPKRLEQAKVLFKYFGHNRYSSFLRQLNNHGFKHITNGADRNCYYHEVRKDLFD